MLAMFARAHPRRSESRQAAVATKSNVWRIITSPNGCKFVSPLSFARIFERSKYDRTPHNGGGTSIPEQQQAYSISDASKRFVLSFP
jgi:hypothetical protein